MTPQNTFTKITLPDSPKSPKIFPFLDWLIARMIIRVINAVIGMRGENGIQVIMTEAGIVIKGVQAELADDGLTKNYYKVCIEGVEYWTIIRGINLYTVNPDNSVGSLIRANPFNITPPS